MDSHCPTKRVPQDVRDDLNSQRSHARRVAIQFIGQRFIRLQCKMFGPEMVDGGGAIVDIASAAFEVERSETR